MLKAHDDTEAASADDANAGFTLIELTVVVLITAVVTAVAYPAYRDQLQRARRSDAVSALMALQVAQEQHRAARSSYAASLAALRWTAVSPGGHYDLQVQQASGTGYTLTATARVGSSQADDGACAQMVLTQGSGVTGYLAAGPGGVPAPDLQHRCWPR